ncbi:dermonecrotic toxin domain-containing protein [Pseudomonas sp. NPDC078416]|uniref:dermonecrotic toxin domain-containing protein n=1 Tax=Pseudomonas sp. NPDC078416 TaxID=3390637 RepID=UPI003D0508F7
MSTVTPLYFHSASLRQRFIHELDRATDAGRLKPEEVAWLRKLTLSPPGHGAAADPDPVRIDRLVLNDGLPTSLEVSAALLFSHSQTADSRIYLFTLADGLAVFDDRPSLLTALFARFAGGNASTGFEYEKVEGDAFLAQMRAVVEFQAASTRQLTAHLRRTPTLFNVLSDTLALQLRRLSPPLHVDPATHSMRIVQPASGADEERVLVTQTLAQTAFEDFCGFPPSPGGRRQFLDAQGRLVSEQDAVNMAQALCDAVTQLPVHYSQWLERFWNAPAQGRPFREIALESYRTSLSHELYGRVQDGTFSEAQYQAMRPAGRAASSAIDTDLPGKRIVLHWADGTRKTLAGTFVPDVGPTGPGPLFWFSPDHELKQFESLSALTAFCSTPEGSDSLSAGLDLADQSLLLRADGFELLLEDIAEPLVAERVESIFMMQLRNLQHVCRLKTQPEKMSAMFDDALDVRRLIDPRQQHFSVGRWTSNVPLNFGRTWEQSETDDLILVDAVSGPDETVLFPYDRAPASAPLAQQLPPSWLEQSQVSDAGAEHLRELDNALVSYAETALQAYICVASPTQLLARDVRLRWLQSSAPDASDVETNSVAVSESLRVFSSDLVSLLLERVSGHRRSPLAHATQIIVPPESPAANFDMELVNFLIERAATDFAARYVEHYEQSQIGKARLGNRQLQPVATAMSLREDVLRLDLALMQRKAALSAASLAMVSQVLDSPVRSQRSGGSATVTDVFTLAIVCDDAPGATISDALVLAQPANASAGAMMWVGPRGWQHFASVEVLSERLLRTLRGPQAERLLSLLSERDQLLLRNHLARSPAKPMRVHMQRVDGHAIRVLQQSVLDRQLQNLQQLCARAARCRFEAQLFIELARSTEVDQQLIRTLDNMSVRIDITLFEELLPPWLKSASVADMKTYNEIWRRYYVVSSGHESFLFDIPSLKDYSRDRLIEQFAKDFPDRPWDPDHITVTLRRYVPGFSGVGQIPSGIPAATLANSESLTDYAINRFVDIQDGTLTVSSVEHPDAVGLLTASYLRSMTRNLDIGASFMVVLRQALNPASPDWPRRSRLYAEQLPPMMQAVAMQQKLEGNLSAEAYAYISRVMEMPDGIAREPVGETPVIISPLRLVADAGMTPDAVKGAYLICPRGAGRGPVILHAIIHPAFVFREYPDLGALLADIRSDEALQRMLLERLDPEVRKRYEHGGFIEPHLPFAAESFGDVPTHTPGPVTVSLAEVKGNALQFLLTDTVNLLVDLGVANTVTTAQADQASLKFLGMLGLEQVLSIMPGKLATVVALWQSHSLLQASAASASGRRWGEAISEFSAALGVMVTAREQADKDDLIEGELATGEELPPTTFEWAGVKLTADQLKRLRALEARNVSLNDLKRDDLLSLYRDSKTQTFYAAVGGTVYPVQRRSEDGQWMIVGEDGTPGPLVRLDGHQRWQLDIGLKGGGGLVTRIRAEGAQRSAEDALIIEATGMQEIRTLYRDRALAIGQAHLQTKRYLENCLDNLNVHSPGTPPDPRVIEIVGDFFGVNPPGQDLLIEAERAVKSLFDEVMDASLSPYSSPRYVVGSTRPGHESTLGFIIKSDPKKRLFLTERFFQLPPYRISAEPQGFDMPAHYRAAVLIHELSHLVLRTHDIAYLETSAPYPDLLLANSANAIKFRTDLERLQREGLSHFSQRDDLFVHMKDGEWSDLDSQDGEACTAVLDLTKSMTLDEARDEFLHDATKRSRVLMKNADSVTLLILRLGRQNFVVPGH